MLVVTLQAWGQQRVDAMRSAIVFGLEPVFAAATAWFLIGERLGAVGPGRGADRRRAHRQPAAAAARGHAGLIRLGRQRYIVCAPRHADGRSGLALDTAARSCSLGYWPSSQ